MNTIDQDFFMKNIPEAFQLRKDWNGEKQKKIVEIDPFFASLIQNSNMLSSMTSIYLTHFHYNSKSQWSCILWLCKHRSSWSCLAKATSKTS